MKLGIILQSNKPEHAWNTFRLGITALKANHQVEIFLMNEGSELEAIPDSKDFDISVKVAEFKELKGEIYACGSCLKVRGKEENNICPVSTMSDLLNMVEMSDKVLVFWWASHIFPTNAAYRKKNFLPTFYVRTTNIQWRKGYLL